MAEPEAAILAPRHHAFVIQEGGAFRVWPPVAISAPRDRFKMRNLTNHSVTVTFPAGLMTPGEATLEPKKSAQFEVNANVGAGVYPYLVGVGIAEGLGAEAIGQSAPRIIIDP